MIQVLKAITPNGRWYTAARCPRCMLSTVPIEFQHEQDGGNMQQQAVQTIGAFAREHVCHPGEAYTQTLLDFFGAGRHGGLFS